MPKWEEMWDRGISQHRMSCQCGVFAKCGNSREYANICSVIASPCRYVTRGFPSCSAIPFRVIICNLLDIDATCLSRMSVRHRIGGIERKNSHEVFSCSECIGRGPVAACWLR